MLHLKIAVSVVRLRPWAPFVFNGLAIDCREAVLSETVKVRQITLTSRSCCCG
jgi:hypothetical protein